MISEDVLGYHIEFYSDTLRRETVSTCYNCDGCRILHYFWHRHILQRNRFNIFQLWLVWCGVIPDSFLGEHIEFQRDQSKESPCILLLESPFPLFAPCVTFLPHLTHTRREEKRREYISLIKPYLKVVGSCETWMLPLLNVSNNTILVWCLING